MNGAEKIFVNILRKTGMEDYFQTNEKGLLSAKVHTGYTIDLYEISIDFFMNTVVIKTASFLRVNEVNKSSVGRLIDSLRNMDKRKGFLIEDNVLCHFNMVPLGQLENMENPFLEIFYGCESFHIYEKQFLKACAGENVFLMRL